MLIVFHTLPIGVGKSALCASVILVESSPVVLLYGMDAQRIRKVRKVYGGIWIETAEINLIACLEVYRGRDFKNPCQVRTGWIGSDWLE